MIISAHWVIVFSSISCNRKIAYFAANNLLSLDEPRLDGIISFFVLRIACLYALIFSDRLLIPGKMENGVTREHASYKGEGIKKADVNLLAYPFKETTDPKQILKDLSYYEARVPDQGTPAMTQAILLCCTQSWAMEIKVFAFSKTATCKTSCLRSA